MYGKAAAVNGIYISQDTSRKKKEYVITDAEEKCFRMSVLFTDNDASELMQGVKDVMLVAACICMLTGVFLTFYKCGDK